MTKKVFDAEAATVDTALTTGNLASQGSTAQQVTPVLSGGGVMMARNSASAVTGAPIHGTKSYDFNCPTSGVSYAKAAETGTTTTQKKQAVTMYHAAAPAVDTTIIAFQGSTGGCASVIHRSTGRIALVNANASTTVYVTDPSTGVLTYPCTVTYDLDLDVGTTGTANTGDGKAHLQIFKHSVSTVTPWATSGTTAENNNYFRTGYIADARVGVQTASVLRLIADSWRIDDGMGFQGTVENPVNSVPVVAIPTAAKSILTGATVSFTATATDAEGDTMTYLWQNDTRPAGASAPTLATSTTLTMTTSALTVPGVYTFKFKANDGTGDSLFAYATAYVAAADGSVSIKARRGSSAYTGAVSNLNDANDATIVVSPDAAVGAVDVWDMNPCKAGDAFTTVPNALTLRMRKRAADGTSDTTATITVLVDVVTTVSDTSVLASPRSFVLTNTITPCQVILSPTESAAFTNHDVWAIRVTTTES